MHVRIEKAFDRKQLYFEHIPNEDILSTSIELKVVVVDGSLLETEFEMCGKSYSFELLHDHSFFHEFDLARKPFLRLIALHAVKTIENAGKMGWIDVGDLVARKDRMLRLARLSLGDAADFNMVCV